MTVFPPPPEHEIAHVVEQIRDETYLLDENTLRARYRAAGMDVDPDPFSPRIIEDLRQALADCRPCSLIRIGDGEASFLALGQDPATPALDRFAMESSVMKFHDRFRASEAALREAQTDMEAAVAAADVIGVVGLWRPRQPTAEQMMSGLIEAISGDVRGISGHWRAIRHMLRMAENGSLAGKAIRSAHLYLGLVRYLQPLLDAAAGTLCITNRPTAVERLRASHPGHEIDLLAINDVPMTGGAMPDTSRSFLHQVRIRLPEELSGRLVLIGAGAWSEVYCTWVKERGGVAVDIGSGFDLLAGKTTRPVHRAYLKSNGLTLESFMNED